MPWTLDSLPLTRAGTVSSSIAASMTGMSNTREAFCPRRTELCGTLKGASETETAAPGAVDENGQIRLAVVGDEIQKEIFAAFCEEYTRFQMIPVREAAGMPFSVSGLLGMIS